MQRSKLNTLACCLGVCLLACWTSTARAQPQIVDQQEASPSGDNYSQIKSAADQAKQKHEAALKSAKTPAEAEPLKESYFKLLVECVTKAHKIAQTKDADARKAMRLRDELMETLAADDVGRKTLGDLAANASMKSLCGLARLALASNLIHQYEAAYLAKDKAAAAKFDEAAETGIRRVKTELGDEAVDNTSIGKLADKRLEQLQHRSLGKVAAEMIGEDLDGKKFKLSDYRGKVVVFYFWATWCQACVQLFPDERKLVARMDKNKFALIGIDNEFNPDRAIVKKYVQDRKLDWTHLWDLMQKQDGSWQAPICKEWDVQLWPTNYVLDAKGVIRYRFVNYQVIHKELDRAVDELIRELDAGKSTRLDQPHSSNALLGSRRRDGSALARLGANWTTLFVPAHRYQSR